MLGKIKAYAVNDKWEDEEPYITFATSANKAKQERTDVFTCDYTDLRAKRLPWADGMEGFSDWDLMVESLNNGWVCIFDLGNQHTTVLSEEDYREVKNYHSEEELQEAYKKGEFKPTVERDDV